MGVLSILCRIPAANAHEKSERQLQECIKKKVIGIFDS